jgi:hypothetical protein
MLNLSNWKTTHVKWVGVILLLIVSTGCASKHMSIVPKEKASYSPKPGKALLVFMRPSVFGGAIQSSVFRVASGTPEFVGIVSSQTKVAYYTDPGKHLFMVVGESADFMEANLQEGKTYYSLVTPRVGFWKARFSLRPVHQEQLKSKQFSDWYESCEWAENTPASYGWAKKNMDSIHEKMADNITKWKAKPEKPILLPTDGR